MEIIHLLAANYPDAKCELNFSSPIELLVAAELSAQCTDVRVNMVTKRLFAKYRCIEDYASANYEEFAGDISQINYFRNKAKNIIAACKRLIADYNSILPESRDQLMELSGVGRKTANLLLSVVYKHQTLVVDTHVIRLSNRLELVSTKDPLKIELSLQEIIPSQFWNGFSSQMIFHGRRCCRAINPKCQSCPLFHICDFE